MEPSSPDSIKTCDDNGKKEKRNSEGTVSLAGTAGKENERSSVLVSHPSKESDITTQKGISMFLYL